MKKYIVVLCLFLLAGNVLASRPNVIVIMADDLGAEGLACYGSTTYTTPHLDRMAKDGAQFLNAYATPLCTPTRVMIMSGLYPNRTGFKALIGKSEGVRMPAAIRTFGHDFQAAGYKTAIAGKWQLGKFDEYPDQPIEHGFDEYCMWTWVYKGKKASRFYKPKIYRAGKIIQGKESDFGPDIFNDFILDFIDRNKDEPFFIYFPMALVHSPFIHPPKLQELAESKYTDDMDKQTRAYGHMITYMDQIVGNIRAKLEEHDLAKKTLVLFTADNGTGKQITNRLPDLTFKGGKGSMTEAGARVPFIAWGPGRVKPGVREELFCLVDVLPTLASMANIDLERKVDGLDLSHTFSGKKGQDREYVQIAYGSGFFVRDKRFRLHQDGRLYDIPVTSDKERYSERLSKNPEHAGHRARLQTTLSTFKAIEAEYKTPGKNPKSKSSRKKEKLKNRGKD
ncbi:MAG: sulfatase-like hydrolase/transferase [Verrucomicrobiota bacterium]